MTDAARVRTRTWGPFTGRQLTTIIVAMVTVVFFPSAAWAVETFSNVAIQDPISGAKAAVDSSRRLQVNGSVSGSSVYALPRPPSTPWNAPVFVNAYSSSAALAGPSSTPINLTSISLGTFGPTVYVSLTAWSVPLAATTCSRGGFVADVYQLAGASSTVATAASFPTPVVVRPPSGAKVCLYARNNSDSTLYLNASGYYGA